MTPGSGKTEILKDRTGHDHVNVKQSYELLGQKVHAFPEAGPGFSILLYQ